MGEETAHKRPCSNLYSSKLVDLLTNGFHAKEIVEGSIERKRGNNPSKYKRAHSPNTYWLRIGGLYDA